ncbi:MAG: hypothetical protein ICV55_04465 [Coleofasciculus sp. C3-bin4]|nr:hypothetical protein [Coleofasciculus sp. C3-bin4]
MHAVYRNQLSNPISSVFICVYLCSLRQAASRLHLWFQILNSDGVQEV